MNPDRLWLRFVRFALLCALLFGFGLATLMTGMRLSGSADGLWYLASIQTHATALLMGWAGVMILGVALHFLPRLRGVKLTSPAWAVRLFWVLALGLTLRLIGQPLFALQPDDGASWQVHLLRGAITGGTALQILGVFGIVTLLLLTFRKGKPLKMNKGFRQITPLLAVAGLSLIGAQIFWGGAVLRGLRNGDSLAVLPVSLQQGAADLMLFGFIAAISIAMSARLFPLTFRIQLPSERGLHAAAVLLGAGAALRAAAAASFSPAWTGTLSLVFSAAGLGFGIFSVRIFHPRKKSPNAKIPYRIWADPASIGVLTAYIWAGLSVIFIVLSIVQKAGFQFAETVDWQNAVRHAFGAGFMTLLIISVGWKMLPGFAGSQPQSPRWLWSAVLLGNIAAALRVSASLFARHPDLYPLYPLAGITGLFALAAFAIALRRSFAAHAHSH